MLLPPELQLTRWLPTLRNQEALEVLTSVSLLLVVALLVRGFHRHARARAAAADCFGTRGLTGVLKWIAVTSCAVLMSGVRIFPLAVLIPWWPWWPIASILTWWLLVGYLRGADSTVTVVIGAVSTLVGAVLLMLLCTFHFSGAVLYAMAGLSLSVPFVLPVGIGTAFLMRRIVGGAPQEDQNPMNLPEILAEFSTPLGRTALWTFAGLLAVLLFDTLALIVLALLFLVRRRRAQAGSTAARSVGRGPTGRATWIAITTCAVLMGWVGSTVVLRSAVVSLTDVPRPLWLVASIVTWCLLARYLPGASTRATVAVGAISTLVGAVILSPAVFMMLYTSQMSAPSTGGGLEAGASLLYSVLDHLWTALPVAVPIGIVTAFLMRWILGGPPRDEAAEGGAGESAALRESPAPDGSSTARSIWTRPVPA